MWFDCANLICLCVASAEAKKRKKRKSDGAATEKKGKASSVNQCHCLARGCDDSLIGTTRSDGKEKVVCND